MASFLPNWLAGALLSVVGSTFSNLGVNVQKYSAMKEDAAVEAGDQDEIRSYWCQPLWVAGFGFVVFGAIFDFSALAFAAQSIVATVGATTLVSNIFFAHLWLGESLSKMDFVGTALILSGSALSVGFGDRSETNYTIDDLKGFYVRRAFLLYVMIAGGVMVFMYGIVRKGQPIRERLLEAKKHHTQQYTSANLNAVLEHEKDIDDMYTEYKRYERLHPLAYCALAGFFGSLVLIFAKSTAELIRATTTGDNQFVDPLTYVFILGMFVCIFTETHFLATGLRFFDALYIVPVFQCFFVSLGAGAGGVFFGEFSSFSVLQVIFFPLGVLITLAGVYLLSSRQMVGQGGQRAAMGKGFISKRRSNVSSVGGGDSKRPSKDPGVTISLKDAEDLEDEDNSGSGSGGDHYGADYNDDTAYAMRVDPPEEIQTRTRTASASELAGGDVVEVDSIQLKQLPPSGTARKMFAGRSGRSGSNKNRRGSNWMLQDFRSKMTMGGGSVIMSQMMPLFLKTSERSENAKAETRYSRVRSASTFAGPALRTRVESRGRSRKDRFTVGAGVNSKASARKASGVPQHRRIKSAGNGREVEPASIGDSVADADAASSNAQLYKGAYGVE